jgi:hypothetical protein
MLLLGVMVALRAYDIMDCQVERLFRRKSLLVLVIHDAACVTLIN